MNPSRCLAVLVSLSAVAAPAGWTPTLAGPYTDALSMCLVRSTTDDDRSRMVQWTFATMALHPGVESMSAVTADRRSELNGQYAAIVERLLTEDCLAEAKEAFRYEGGTTFETSFGVLGQVAMRDLLTSPDVVASIEEFAGRLDPSKFEAIGIPADELHDEAAPGNDDGDADDEPPADDGRDG